VALLSRYWNKVKKKVIRAALKIDGFFSVSWSRKGTHVPMWYREIIPEIERENPGQGVIWPGSKNN
jgi:hypothetical protein